MEPRLSPCPHCGSDAKFTETHGNMKSFPSVDIVCKNKDCYGSMHVTYDEFYMHETKQDTNGLKRKMAECWNRRYTGGHILYHPCRTCGKKEGSERFDLGLSCGVHCDKCFEAMVADGRARSW
jgi:hypothetical protein